MSTSYPPEQIVNASPKLKDAGRRSGSSLLQTSWLWVVERSTTWTKVGTVMLVCLASFALGYRGSFNQLTLVVAALGGLLGVSFFVLWPGFGVIAILLSGMFVQYTGPGGFNGTMALVALLIGLWVLEMVIFRQDLKIVASITMPPIIAMMVTVTISFAMGQLPWFSFAGSAPIDAQLGGYAVYLLSFGAFLLIANQVKDIRWLKWFTWLFIIFGSIYVIQLLVPAFRSLNRMMYVNMGSMFWVWLIAIVYSQALFNDEISIEWRGVLLVIFALSMYLLFTLKFKDKSGWVPAMIVLWVITALRSWQLGLVLLLLGGLGTSLILPEVLTTEDYSLSTRLEVLPIMAQILQVNPMFGVGFANYYWYTPLFALRGYYISFNSHNNYADLLVQTGVLGAIIYFWLLGQIGLLAWNLKRKVKDGFSVAYVNGVIGGFVGMGVVAALGDWVLPFVYNIGLSGFRTSVFGWLFLGGLVVLEQHYKAKTGADRTV